MRHLYAFLEIECLYTLILLMATPRDRLLRWERRQSALDSLPSPPTPPKHTYPEYANSKHLKSDKHLHSYEREKLRRQEL